MLSKELVMTDKFHYFWDRMKEVSVHAQKYYLPESTGKKNSMWPIWDFFVGKKNFYGFWFNDIHEFRLVYLREAVKCIP